MEGSTKGVHLLLLLLKSSGAERGSGVLGPELKRQVSQMEQEGRLVRGGERLSGEPKDLHQRRRVAICHCVRGLQPTALRSSGWMTKAWEPGDLRPRECFRR